MHIFYVMMYYPYFFFYVTRYFLDIMSFWYIFYGRTHILTLGHIFYVMMYIFPQDTFDVTTYFFTLSHIFYAMMYVPCFLTSRHTFRGHDVLFNVTSTCVLHDISFDLMTYFEPYDACTFHTFWHYDILFDVMTYLLMPNMTYLWYFSMSSHTFWRHDMPYDLLFDVMMYFFMSWCTFYV